MIGKAEQEAWLEANTFRCPHLHARIRPEQCAELRGLPENGNWNWNPIFPIRCRPCACSRCGSWEEFQAQAKDGREDPVARKVPKAINGKEQGVQGRMVRQNPSESAKVCEAAKVRTLDAGKAVKRAKQAVRDEKGAAVAFVSE